MTVRAPLDVTLAALDELVAAKGWPRCDLWSLDLDADHLSAESIAEALELGTLRDTDHAIAWFSRWKLGTLPVYGWTRKRVTDEDIDRMVEHLTDQFHEFWCESLELGDPEDADERTSEPPWLRAAVTADMRARHVWSCEHTHTVELAPADVIAIAQIVAPVLKLWQAWGGS